MKDKIPPRKSVETRIITHRDRCDETSPHVFHRPRDGGWFEIEGCLSWRGSTDVVDVAFPVQGRGENLGWVACRRKYDVSAFGGQPHGELRGRPITDLTSDDPAVYTELVACRLIQLTPRHTNTRLNTRVALCAYADAFARVGPPSVEPEHDRCHDKLANLVVLLARERLS